ncbi:MAG TPA: FAD-binding oxidoreductase [Ktedonobacteraceae bacterium]
MIQNLQIISTRDQNRSMRTEATPQREGQLAWRQALWMLKAHLQGELLPPDDDDYAAARTVWNAAIDRHPAMIIRCLNAADVQAAVTFAREYHLAVSVRSGGHSPAGFGTTDGGMVIDLSRMKAISIDPIQRTARLQPGLTWAEVAQAAHPYGLALTSGDTGSVGVGGLLLGGGMGWMVRKYGLTIDRLRAVELVTADGHFLRASAQENADLFWGLRGGGGNFGVATAFEVDLHPAGTVLGGTLLYDATHAGDTERMVRAYAHLAAAAPDELTTIGMLLCAPQVPFIPQAYHGKPVFMISVCYTGDLALGERVVAPLRTLGTPIADLVARMPYPAMFALTEEAAKRGRAHDGRALLLRTLDDEALRTLVREALVFMAPGVFVQLRVLGGAMSRVAREATAFAHRDAQAMVVVGYGAPKTAQTACLQASMGQIWQAIRPYSAGAYVNFLMEEREQRVHEAYPPATYARLVALKRRYDPTNLFHLNQNIAPARTGWLSLK